MREILFRGKRIDNGEWVYGLLCRVGDTYANIVEKSTEVMCTVLTNTIGLYTGKTDTCGTQIFENDICRFDNGEEFKGKDRFSNYVVQWDSVNTRYVVVDAWNCEDILDDFFSRNAIVIGNIHDNPELLEGKP